MLIGADVDQRRGVTVIRRVLHDHIARPGTGSREAERELISKMLQQTRWNRKETAEILGISYKALLYKIKENGLDKTS